MTLREKAQRWLDSYKESDSISSDVYVSIKEWAIIVAVFLNETDPDKTEGEDTSERIKALQGKAELLHGDLVEEQDKRRKLEEALQASEKACDYMGSQLTEARGKISAYEFVIRCNGMSGAEVRS